MNLERLKVLTQELEYIEYSKLLFDICKRLDVIEREIGLKR